MIELGDLPALAAWCRSRGLYWLPGRAEMGDEALLLEQRGGHRSSESMLLVRDGGGYCLIDPLGDLLASASSLPALFDALDGGIAEAPRRAPVVTARGYLREPVAVRESVAA